MAAHPSVHQAQCSLTSSAVGLRSWKVERLPLIKGGHKRNGKEGKAGNDVLILKDDTVKLVYECYDDNEIIIFTRKLADVCQGK
jgi:hypothetical protein